MSLQHFIKTSFSFGYLDARFEPTSIKTIIEYVIDVIFVCDNISIYN